MECEEIKNIHIRSDPVTEIKTAAKSVLRSLAAVFFFYFNRNLIFQRLHLQPVYPLKQYDG